MKYKELVHRLISISLVHRCRISKSAHKVGLYYGQPMVLEFITRNKHCTQKDLADGLHISPASVATSIKRLEKAGLIERVCDTYDTRKKLLTLTDKGIEALQKFREICEKTDKEMFAGFTEEECQTLESLLKRLYNNLDADSFSKKEINEILNNKGGNG